MSFIKTFTLDFLTLAADSFEIGLIFRLLGFIEMLLCVSLK